LSNRNNRTTPISFAGGWSEPPIASESAFNTELHNINSRRAERRGKRTFRHGDESSDSVKSPNTNGAKGLNSRRGDSMRRNH
jgi:hypothetical protein